MIFKNFPYGGLLPEMMPVRDQAYRPIRDTVAFKKGGKVKATKQYKEHLSEMKKGGVKKHKKGSAEMKAHMALLRKMKKWASRRINLDILLYICTKTKGTTL